MNQKYNIYLITLFIFSSCAPLNFSEYSDSSLNEGYEIDENTEIDCSVERTEVFSIDELKDRPIEFIFVIDASGSMSLDLLKLGQGFKALISKIESMDWRMMFTLAWNYGPFYSSYTGPKPYNGQFMQPEYNGALIGQYYLDKTTPNYEQAFLDTLTRADARQLDLPPYSHGSYEQPLRALKNTFERLGNGESHVNLRDEADVVAVIITDEDEDTGVSAEQVISAFNKYFPDKQLLAFAVLVKPEDPACRNEQASRYGFFTSQLPIATEGKNISICEADYSQPLEVSSRVILDSQNVFKLKHYPCSKKDVEVKFTNGDAIDWELRGKKIKFESTLNPGTTINVTYSIPVGTDDSDEDE